MENRLRTHDSTWQKERVNDLVLFLSSVFFSQKCVTVFHATGSGGRKMKMKVATIDVKAKKGVTI